MLRASALASLAALLLVPALRAAPGPDAPGIPAVTPVGFHGAVPVGRLEGPASVLGVQAWAPERPRFDGAAPPEAPTGPDDGAPAPRLADDAREEGPTLDSLQMSRWERLWWGRRGVFRVTGLFPTHPDEPAADFRQIAQVRRRMLSTHQLLGLATVGAMAATVVGGQLAIQGRNSAFHKTVAPITIGMYATTATLSILAPPPLFKGSGGVSSITIHKWLAIGHMTGMVLTPLLAPSNGRWSRRHLHQALGYSTFATFSAAMLTVTFFR